MTLESTDVRSLFQRTLDALPDGVLLTDGVRRVVYVNRAFSQLWRIPDELLAQQDDLILLAFVQDQLLDPEGFGTDVERLQLSIHNSEDEVLLKDGRIFSRRSVPFSEKGHIAARIWIFTDITEARSASVDALTGIPNRHAYSREFPRYLSACGEGILNSIAILDVDNFKRYNDAYGHAAGDDVLHRIGTVIRNHFTNADDLFFRIGGEEFLMASRTRAALDAHTFYDALRDQVGNMGIEHVGNQPFGIVTISVGLGIFEGPQSAAEVFRYVDAALYQSKQRGRNRVTLARTSNIALAF
jgi:diguanylate cyclase (GGDEF)-like protein